jgi:hypothetical protein
MEKSDGAVASHLLTILSKRNKVKLISKLLRYLTIRLKCVLRYVVSTIGLNFKVHR